MFTATNKDGISGSTSQTLSEGASPPQSPPPVSTGPSVDYNGNWSGFEMTGRSFTAVSGAFNVPDLYTAATPTSTAEWVGIGGLDGPLLIQAGVAESWNPATGLTHYAWYEILPAPKRTVPLRVTTGNQISVLISRVAGTTWQISIANKTNGQRFSTDVRYAGSVTSAEWILEAPSSAPSGGVIATLGRFAPNVTFTDTRYTGNATDLTEDVMVQDESVVATPSPIASSGAFTVGYGPTAPNAP